MNNKYEVVEHEGKQVFAHHLILPPVPGMDVDHINGDRKDNRPENLRYLPRRLNALHRFREDAGVDFMRRKGKWRARIAARHIGVFNTKEEAIAARTAALKEALNG